MSASRTYLSIGDVLTLLRDEFPDVTISKIRFLESQGLVNPERSPSGYRKFFDHDVERLRWVLRQQREHFLPLKVIRDRLADGELDDVTAGDANGNSSASAHPAHASRSAAATAVNSAGAGSAGGASGGYRAEEQPTKADEEAMARILADASRRAARLPADAAPERKDVAAKATQGAQATQATQAAPADRAGRAPDALAANAAAPQTTSARAARGGRDGVATGATGVVTPEAAPARSDQPAGARSSGAPRHAAGGAAPGRESGGSAGSSSSSARPSGGRGASTGGTGTGTGPATTAGIVTGASLTADELCSASGLSPEELAGLESFGLIEPVPVAGILTYDEDALTIANLATSFRNFGIEPRHLRLYRNSVDREMGLIEQVVIPLLRQRNPESRQRAGESADQLAALGQSMRATLLRLALRRHMGG